MDKREFLKAISASLILATTPKILHSSNSIIKKKVLVLGGRNFIGPSIVKIFKKSGWDVTLLNRGITNPTLFKELPIIICDREKKNRYDLIKKSTLIKNSHWDCVIDTWQKSPKAVQDFIEEFKDDFSHYHYISTVSVYNDWNEKGIDETRPLNPVPKFPDNINENFRYAIRKTLSEITISDNLTNYTIYRSHGMRDFRTPDHTNPAEEDYWPIRFARGGEILVPDAQDHYYQITDVQSLCKFILHCAENKIYGAYNVAYKPIEFKKYISSLMTATTKSKNLIWILGDFLIKNGLKPYKDISAWKPSPAGSYHFNVNKAIANGLKNRSLDKLIRDQINGYKSRYPNDSIKFGEMQNGKETGDFSSQKEKEIIEKWLSIKK
jgi:2'-hydroxyisoflavone reductase